MLAIETLLAEIPSVENDPNMDVLRAVESMLRDVVRQTCNDGKIDNQLQETLLGPLRAEVSKLRDMMAKQQREIARLEAAATTTTASSAPSR